MTGSEVPAERLGTATEIARALGVPVGTVHRYASEHAIQPAGERVISERLSLPLYDVVSVAAVRHARRVARGLVDA